MTSRWKFAACILWVSMTFVLQAEAQTEARPTSSTTQETSSSDWAENLGRIYKNDANQTLQELWLLGRYHGQYHWTEGSAADDDGYETRRFRIGSQAKLFNKLTFHAQMVSGSDFEPVYNGFTELWAQWAFNPALMLSIGQQKNRFTHDRNVSSRYLNYLERAMLTNMFSVDYTPAVTLQGKFRSLSYYTGIFSNATGQNIGDAFTELDSGYSLIAAAYYDLEKPFDLDSAYLYGSFVHSDANENATNLNHFENGASTALIVTKHSSSLVTELTGGQSDQGNAVGINIQPGDFITNRLQVVARYQLAASNSDNGLKAQRRYEREVDIPNGDLYQAGYLGFNYYILKHRLKFMNGIEYANMSSEHAWTVSSFVRLYFGPHSAGAFPMNQMLPGHFFDHD